VNKWLIRQCNRMLKYYVYIRSRPFPSTSFPNHNSWSPYSVTVRRASYRQRSEISNEWNILTLVLEEISVSEQFLVKSISSTNQDIFLFSVTCRKALGPTQALVQWVPGAVSPRVKRDADHSPPSRAEVKKDGAIPLLPHAPARQGA
jgi:hypothetical protein